MDLKAAYLKESELLEDEKKYVSKQVEYNLEKLDELNQNRIQID